MRNFLGALAAMVGGSLLIAVFLSPTPNVYPVPIDVLWFLLGAGEALQETFLMILDPNTTVIVILLWVLMGGICGVASKSRWNTVRTILWLALLITIFYLVSVFVLDPSLWLADIASRNIMIILAFVNSVLTSLLALVGAIPVVSLVSMLQAEGRAQPPDKIETICDCGAVFRSRPLICAECGKALKHEGDDN